MTPSSSSSATAGAQSPQLSIFHTAEPSARQTTPTVHVRARRTDPETSKAAAAKAQEFADSHAGRIHLALMRAGNATGKELAAATGYSMEQVCRRLPELHALGMARVVMQDSKALVRCGARVWEAAA